MPVNILTGRRIPGSPNSWKKLNPASDQFPPPEVWEDLDRAFGFGWGDNTTDAMKAFQWKAYIGVACMFNP
ncbi:MAG: hypothetical protein JWP29_5646 [Rhodoferax sp.]|nr:hypothetical protein [Rhodoferax sp.]